MPLGMLGSCTDRCGPCEGCFGGFSQEGCKLRWATSGDPYAVEIRLNAAVISTQQSGFLANPSSGAYELWVRCNSGDEWELLDSENWVKRAESVCRPCCIEAGAYQNPPRYVRISCGGSFWSRFNGVYQLTPVLNQIGNPSACSYQASVTFPHSNPSPASAEGFCNCSGGWMTSGWYAGSYSVGTCSASNWLVVTNAVYWLHEQILITLDYGTGGYDITLQVTLVFSSRLLRLGFGSGSCFFAGRTLFTATNGTVAGFMNVQPGFCGTISGSMHQEFEQSFVFCPGTITSIPVPTPLDMTADVLP